MLVGISTILFFVLRLSGDPMALLAPPGATAADLAALRAAYGLDRPLIVQYALFLQGMAQLDFGRSLRFGRPALELVIQHLPSTVLLVTAAAGFAIAVAVPLGVLAATKRRSWLGGLILSLSSVGQATPVFWLALLLILIFGVRLGWLPTFGADTPLHLILPASTLGAFMMAKIARFTYSGMVGTLQQEFIRTAEAKGVPSGRILFRHALRNALIPVVTIVGLELSYMLGGAVIIETVFSWPGLGRQLMQAVLARDYPLVQAAVFIIALLTVVINFLVDVVYRLLDPRVQLH